MKTLDLLQQETQALSPELLDETALRLPAIRLFRVDDRGVRLYYTYDFGEITFFPGVTGMLGKMLATPEALINWKAEKGVAEARRYMEERACYGSLMHSLFTHLLIKRSIDLDEMPEIVHNYFLEHNCQTNISARVHELKKDLLAFAQWILEFNVAPLAIELPLCSQRYGVATLVDLVCELDVTEKGFFGEVYKSGAQKGKPKETKETKRRKAIVDFKSSKNSYSSPESHEYQLLFCQELVKENFPEFAETDFYLFNWHPKDWRTSPGCHCLDQTGKHQKRELELMAELYHIRHTLQNKSKVFTQGVIDLDKGQLAENFEVATYAEVLGGESV